MTIMKTENLKIEELFPPSTGTGMGQAFTVGRRSLVCRLSTPTGEDIGVDDSFELHTVLEYVKATGVVTRSYAIVEAVAGALLLGANNTQAEIVLRGVYAWKKIVATTPLVGVEGIVGYEKVL